MTWRLAKSLVTLRDQLNAAYPNRSKLSDGYIGDYAHSLTASDHNPNPNGVVTAMDITHDPKNGLDAHKLAEHLRTHRHPNLRYIISNARIAGVHTGWQWRPSVGHTQHVHVSVGNGDVADGQTTYNYDSAAKWDIGINEKEIDMLDDAQLNVLMRLYRADSPTKAQRNQYVGKVTFADMQKRLKRGAITKSLAAKARQGKLDAKNHLPTELRTVYKAPTPAEYVEVTDKLYRKK